MGGEAWDQKPMPVITIEHTATVGTICTKLIAMQPTTGLGALKKISSDPKNSVSGYEPDSWSRIRANF